MCSRLRNCVCTSSTPRMWAWQHPAGGFAIISRCHEQVRCPSVRSLQSWPRAAPCWRCSASLLQSMCRAICDFQRYTTVPAKHILHMKSDTEEQKEKKKALTLRRACCCHTIAYVYLLLPFHVQLYILQYQSTGESHGAGYEEQKQEIEDTLLLALQHPDVYEAIAAGTRRRPGSNRPRAVLFEGPPGCGKTTSARSVTPHARTIVR